VGDAAGDGAGGGSSRSLVLGLGLSRGATSAKLLERGGWRGAGFRWVLCWVELVLALLLLWRCC